jgi:hypothetical protein
MILKVDFVEKIEVAEAMEWSVYLATVPEKTDHYI